VTCNELSTIPPAIPLGEPVNQADVESVSQAGFAVAAGIVDMKPTVPIEGIFIAKLVVANEAALSMYQRA
jgi:hypothetical protein